MSRAIAVCNQKGGVGKSTTAVNVGSYLAISGRRTIIIDLDPQANASTACGVRITDSSKGSYGVLVNNVAVEEAIRRTAVDNLDLIPSHVDLAAAEGNLAGVEGREQVLRRICGPLRERYEVLIFDCPPSLGLLTVNALVAADSTIIPVQCEYLALEGLNALLRSVALIREKLNGGLKVGGIVLTMTDFRATLAREVAHEVRTFFRDLVFETAIPRNIRLAESPSFGKPICLYDPHSAGALAYQMLAQEVMSKELAERI